jgi:hypothetical protein
MLTKLASLLTTAKGAAAATLIAGSALAGGTVAAVPEAREAVTGTAAGATTDLGEAVAAVAHLARERRAADTSCGKPEVVAQRNEADRQLRDAFHEDHQALIQLRGGKAADVLKANSVVKAATADLRAVLRVALIAVAAETQGRTGQVAKANAAASPVASSARATASPSAASASESPSLAAAHACSEGATDDETAKVDVTLNATLASIVEKAVKDMAAIVEKATAGAGGPATEAKKSDEPGRGSGTKPADAPKGAPSDRPGGKPSTPPGRR